MFKFIISLCYLSPIRLHYFFSSYTPTRKHAPSHTNPYHPEDGRRERGVSRQRASDFWNHLAGDEGKEKVWLTSGRRLDSDNECRSPSGGGTCCTRPPKSRSTSFSYSTLCTSRTRITATEGFGVQDFPGNGGRARQKTRINRRS